MKLGYIIAAALLMAAIAGPVLSQESAQVVAAESANSFIKKRYKIHGDWAVSSDNGQTIIAFDDDFKTKGGPALKVYLSPKPIETLTGQTALADSLYLGVLKSNEGAQQYRIPDDIDISQYSSLIIQCEAYSVLWGGFDLPSGDS